MTFEFEESEYFEAMGATVHLPVNAIRTPIPYRSAIRVVAVKAVIALL